MTNYLNWKNRLDHLDDLSNKQDYKLEEYKKSINVLNSLYTINAWKILHSVPLLAKYAFFMRL